MTRTTARLTGPTTALLAGALLLAGCSAGTSSPAAEPPAPPAANAGTLSTAHVHGVAVDPGDGAVLLATHDGLVEVGDGGEPSAIGPVIDLMGFTVAGPDHYLASGHPGPGVNLPNPVGLIETTDGGRTWTPISRSGESDFHALTALPGGGVLGYDGVLRRSTDGTTWEQLSIPAEPHTLAAAPHGAVLATTSAGLLHSADGGTSWTPVEGAPVLQVVAWSDDGTTAVGITPSGAVWASADPFGTWQQRARLDGAPEAVSATHDGGILRILAVTEQGLLESVDDGATFTPLLER